MIKICRFKINQRLTIIFTFMEKSYMMKLLEVIQLKIGCYWGYLSLFTFLLFILLVPHYSTLAIMLFIFMILTIFFAFIYYQHYAKERLNAFTKMLIETGKKKLLVPNSKAHVISKKGKACNRFLTTRKEYQVSILYFSDEFLTISTKCPKFNLFKLVRGKIKEKWAIKKSCASNKEFYYAYIQSVHFNSESKQLDIVLTSGDIESIEADKKPAEAAVNILRERLRNTERGVQTNPIKT